MTKEKIDIIDIIDIMMKEYETLRQESMDSINNRSHIVSFGLASIGILAAGFFSSETALGLPFSVCLVFSYAIPAVSILVLYIWLGEVERMMRAGSYLRELEARINKLIDRPDPTLQWEQWLRTSHTQMTYPYLVVIMLFLGLTFGGPLIGIVLSQAPALSRWWTLAVPWVAGFGVALHVGAKARTFE